jgi:hypothetical protein
MAMGLASCKFPIFVFPISIFQNAAPERPGVNHLKSLDLVKDSPVWEKFYLFF